MKKLIVLISSLLLSSTAFSQKDTVIKDKSFPIPIVRLIMKDLITGDSAKAQLSLTEKQLLETEKKVFLKDSIINGLRNKEINYIQVNESQLEKFNIQKEYSKKLENQLKIEKVKNKYNTTIGAAIIIILTTLLIVK